MNKYCPAGKIECENYGYNSHNKINVCGNNDEMFIKVIDDFEQCPWPSRQVPVELEHKNFLREQYLIFEKAGYERGRIDMKREILGKVDKIEWWHAGRHAAIAAIEGVK